jgi:hypothetical protein
MLLSFSEAPMLSYVRAGIRQALGEDVGDERVKRQTIRLRGKRAAQLLRWDPVGHTIALALHLYWKSRTPKRERLGVIPAQLVRVYELEIQHLHDGGLRIAGPQAWRDGGAIFWSPGRVGCAHVASESRSGGFDSPEAFRDYFVPNPGDRFDAILFKW